MLTAKQHELLMFIHSRLGRTGVSPSFDEMREALDLKSKSGVHRLISALEERSLSAACPSRARLEILRIRSIAPLPSQLQGRPPPLAVAAPKPPLRPPKHRDSAAGRIAARHAIEACMAARFCLPAALPPVRH